MIFERTIRPDEALFFRRNEPGDPRWGERVRSDPNDYHEAKVVVLGCPQDEGVRRNGRICWLGFGSIHPGQVIVGDGTEAAARRLERVLTSDPGMGVVHHADAGYPVAIEFAKAHGIRIPMENSGNP